MLKSTLAVLGLVLIAALAPHKNAEAAIISVGAFPELNPAPATAIPAGTFLVPVEISGAANLQLWQFDGSWHQIVDPTFHIDSTSNLISGRLNNPTFFAVLTPEPTALTPILLFVATLLKRHRRRRRL